MEDFVDERWRLILAHNGLKDFESLWALKTEWFEEPNHRRGGWSGVSRCELDLPGGGACAIFLKRQENHNTFSWLHPIKGAPTFCREFKRIMSYQRKGIPSLEPVYFASRQVGKDQRAILVTAELSGFVSLEDCVQIWRKEGVPLRRARLDILREIASLLRKMHLNGIQHNCFYPKHVFVRVNADSTVDARVIDLEKSRWRPLKVFCALRDLSTLNYPSMCWSRSDRLWFFMSYLELKKLSPFSKWLWRTVSSRTLKKGRVHVPNPLVKVGR